jgi:hypothetical protein
MLKNSRTLFSSGSVTPVILISMPAKQGAAKKVSSVAKTAGAQHAAPLR